MSQYFVAWRSGNEDIVNGVVGVLLQLFVQWHVAVI